MDSVRVDYFSGQIIDCIQHMDKAAEMLCALQEHRLGHIDSEMLAVFTKHRSEILAAAENLHRVATALDGTG